MKLIVSLVTTDDSGRVVGSPSRQERVVIRPSRASTVVEEGPFTVTFTGSSELLVESNDIEFGFSSRVGGMLMESGSQEVGFGSYRLTVTVEPDDIADCEFAPEEDADDDPTDGRG